MAPNRCQQANEEVLRMSEELFLRDFIGLKKFMCLSGNHCVIFTCVTLKLHCSQPNRINKYKSYQLL